MPKTKKDRTVYTTYEHVRDVSRTAIYFDFLPEKITITDEDKKSARSIDNKETTEADPAIKAVDFVTEEKAALLRIAIDRGVQGGQPLMIYHEKDTRTGTLISLDVVGNNRAVSEALLIAAARAIIKDAGIDTMVVVNCVGDKDSTQRFIRALSEYYRRNIDILHPTCRQLLKKNVFGIIACAHEKCKTLSDGAPRSMNFLSEPSRIHFKEVLDYLDSSGIPYTITDTLLPSKSYTSHTVFQFVSTDEKNPEVIAYGARYNNLSKRLGAKRELGAAGITISLTKKQAGDVKKKIKIARSPFFFIHIGTEARFKSIGVLEMLRENNIPMSHAVIKDKLSVQLQQAEELKVSHILLMGQKECIDESVLVRDTQNRSQQAIKIVDLVAFIKKLL